MSLLRTYQIYSKTRSIQFHYFNLFRFCIRRTPNIVQVQFQAYSKSNRGVSQQRKLFIPGPLMVSDRVKEAMLADLGTRHSDFSYIVKFVRNSLLQISRVTDNDYTVIPLNGNGTFAIESALRTTFGCRRSKVVVMANGIHGKRIADMCQLFNINVQLISVCKEKLQNILMASNDVSGVIVVHCETSTGLINPVNDIAETTKKLSPDCLVFVDAMTSFGAIHIDMRFIDFLISNSYKCLQGVPGISFVIAKKAALQKHRWESADSMSLDLGAQLDELDKSGQFRFTPPTHVMLAFKEALLEFSEEGGLEGRSARYKENSSILKSGMAEMGFNQFFKDEENPQGYIVTSYCYPNNPLFVFDEFYNRLSDSGHVICNQSTSELNCFRIGTIGHLFPDDIRDLLTCIRQVCSDMRIPLPLVEHSF